MIKRFLMTVFICCSLFAVGVYGAEGSLTIDSEPYNGIYYTANFSIFKIAEKDCTFTDDFAGLNIDLSDIESAYESSSAADTVASYISKNNIAYLDKKSAERSVAFSNLDEGYYFLLFNKTEIANMSSFIISIPYYDSDSDKSYYDVSVTAKISVDSGGASDKSGGGGSGGSIVYVEENSEIVTLDTPSSTDSTDTDTNTDTDIPYEFDEPDIDMPDDTDNPENPDEFDEELPSEADTTADNPNGDPTDPKEKSNVNLPKTGGDKTVLLCNYSSAVLAIIGILILLFNNLRNKLSRKAQ